MGNSSFLFTVRIYSMALELINFVLSKRIELLTAGNAKLLESISPNVKGSFVNFEAVYVWGSLLPGAKYEWLNWKFHFPLITVHVNLKRPITTTAMISTSTWEGASLRSQQRPSCRTDSGLTSAQLSTSRCQLSYPPRGRILWLLKSWDESSWA